jgi:hypothetical protein
MSIIPRSQCNHRASNVLVEADQTHYSDIYSTIAVQYARLALSLFQFCIDMCQRTVVYIVNRMQLISRKFVTH